MGTGSSPPSRGMARTAGWGQSEAEPAVALSLGGAVPDLSLHLGKAVVSQSSGLCRRLKGRENDISVTVQWDV